MSIKAYLSQVVAVLLYDYGFDKIVIEMYFTSFDENFTWDLLGVEAV